ncbi:MAG: hypothetical protein JNJ54_26665 [Myxococcaceae bacterium]|nr:hypothetical protein [Myxococcaceae bacterium]
MSAEARGWLAALEAALSEARMDRVEALRRTVPPAIELASDQAALQRVVTRLAALTGRSADRAGPEQLPWWLDALLLQRVIVVPRSRGRALVPALFISLAALLGLLIGRIAAASIMTVGLVVWAIRSGGAVRERHGDWLRLGDTLFDLRRVRAEPLSADWYLLEGHRVPAAVLADLGVIRTR